MAMFLLQLLFVVDFTKLQVGVHWHMQTKLLARSASRRPGTPLEWKMDAQILGKKGKYFQLFP